MSTADVFGALSWFSDSDRLRDRLEARATTGFEVVSSGRTSLLVCEATLADAFASGRSQYSRNYCNRN